MPKCAIRSSSTSSASDHARLLYLSQFRATAAGILDCDSDETYYSPIRTAARIGRIGPIWSEPLPYLLSNTKIFGETRRGLVMGNAVVIFQR